MPYSPYMESISLTTATTVYNLATLIAAIDKNAPVACAGIRLEMDIGATGKVRVGNLNVSATHCGYVLVPAQEANVAQLNASPGGKLLTSDVYLVGDTNAQQINVTLLPVGT